MQSNKFKLHLFPIIKSITMKKTLFIALLMFAGSFAFAQSPLTFGVKGGFTSSKLNSDVDETKNSILGYQVGVFGRLSSKKIYIQPELYFTRKGGEMKYESNGQPIANYTVKLNTFDIPLLIGYKLVDAKLANVHVMAGPVASFVYNKDISLKNGVPIEQFKDKKFEDASWSIQAGAGIDVLSVSLDVRYEWGITDIYKPSGQDFKNNIFLVSLGWKLF